MRPAGRHILGCILLALAGSVFFLAPANGSAEEDYSFDLEEFEPKAFEWGGYAQLQWEHLDLNSGSAFHGLNFYRDPRSSIDRFTGLLQLEFGVKRGAGAFNTVLQAEAGQDDLGWSDRADVFEANLSFKPNPFATVDIGKKVFKWGKGYAWNPIGFIGRAKDPNNPEESLEGYLGAGLDLIKSFDGSLQTAALTTVVLPVWEDVNEDFGALNHINLAAKLYLLYRDTDIDVAVLAGDSRSTRYGVDFAKNLASNVEIHGEYAFLHDVAQKYLDAGGKVQRREVSASEYLLGLRYLTANDITTIIEYYHNGTGFSEAELERFYGLVADADQQLRATGTDTLFQNAQKIAALGYARPQVGRNYLYLKISQKEPFDILYVTPGLTAICNLDDHSYSVSPEILYTGFTNWEMRLRLSLLTGDDFTEFGEKQNQSKLELRVRYHF